MTDSASLRSLARLLDQQAGSGRTLTYRDVALALGLAPPHTIHQVAVLLEELMRRDAAAGRPLRAALVVSRSRNGRPAPGFFELARELGLFDGDDAGGFHDRELARLSARSADHAVPD